MTQPYLFRWFSDGHEAVAPVRLDKEPVVGGCVWIAGNRYKIDAVDELRGVVVISKPPRGYREKPAP